MNESTTLELSPAQPGEPPMKQLAPFDAFKAQLASLKATAETITVSSVSQVAEMKIARSTRLALREIRIAVEHKRKELGEHHLREKQRVDGDAKAIREAIEPLEARLLAQEEFIARETLRIEDGRREARADEIAPFLCAPVCVDLGKMSDAEYAALLADMRGAHEARAEREAKEEAARVAVEKAESEERERIRLENERLKKEAAEREAALVAERVATAEREKAAREKAAVEAALAAKKAREEREAIEAKAKAEREVLEAKAAQERAEAEKARLQMEHLAAVEKKKADDAARALREAREKLEAEAKARAAAEAAAKKTELAAIKKAASAPDREKLRAFADAVRALHVPKFSNDSVTASLRALIAQFAEKIEQLSSTL